LDIAVLKLESGANPLPQDNFGNSDEGRAGLRLGSPVIAIGSPFGLDHTVTTGIISQFNRSLDPANPVQRYLQTDAAINKGNSGGPLFNLKGEVVGIDTAIFSPSGGSVGLGFALPANDVKKVVDAIISSPDHIAHFGAMNVVISETHDEARKGLLVGDVKKDGAAEKAGLKKGDIIVALNGQPVGDMATFKHTVVMMMKGATPDVTFIRDGQEQHLTVTLDDASLDKVAPAPTVVVPPKDPKGIVIPGLPGLNAQ
jgi:serine protease Do